MLFELRNATPDVSDVWLPLRDSFLAGRVRNAHAAATKLRRFRSLSTPNDYILNVEIARACHQTRHYLGLVRLAHRAYPRDPFVQLYQARALLTRRMFTAGIDYLHALEPTLGASHRGLWASQLANMYADAGFEPSSEQWLAVAETSPEADSPLGLYTRSCTHEGAQHWDQAIHLAEACIAAAPKWSRARTHYVHCLLSRGRIEDARRAIDEGQSLGHEDASLDLVEAMLAFSLGSFDAAGSLLSNLLVNWPHADFASWVRRTLGILLVESGRIGEAKELLAGQEEAFALPPGLEMTNTSPHHFIALPLVAQLKNQCVPTTVSMSLYPQGDRIDADQLFREMNCREGTPLWKMRQWLERHGYRLIPIRLEREPIIELLEHDVPLIGPLEGPFSSHVDVLCGYHDALRVFYVRDPAHWAPAAWPYELALERYEIHGAVLAAVDASRADLLALAERHASSECEALLELGRAVAAGERERAEVAYARIPDASKLACLRDGMSVHVAISPQRYQENMQRVAQDEEANPIARLRALWSLDPLESRPAFDQLLEQEGDKISASARRHLHLVRAMYDGDWPRARNLVERMLVFNGAVPDYWEMKSDILAELGDQAASAAALDRAIELAPYRMRLREKALNRSSTRLSFAEYLDEFDALLASDPDDKRLLWGRMIAIQDGPDGKAFERAARDYLRWWPREPRGYQTLSHWYEIQQRNDLAQGVLAEARSLLGDSFMHSSVNATLQASTDDATTAQLPTAKDELLTLIWAHDNPRRGAAVERLIQMEEEGHLPWFDRARLLANRLVYLGSHGTTGEEPAAAARRMLPLPTPGPPHWFVNLVLEVVTQYQPPIGVALAVDEWTQAVVPGFANYSNLWFNRVLVLELAHRMEQAYQELEALLARYPATSSALYRMGVVKYQQQDYPASLANFARALQVNPGLVGAIQMQRTIHEHLGDEKETRACIRAQRKKFPYDFNLLRDEAYTVCQKESLDAARDILIRDKADFPPQRMTVLEAQLHINRNELDWADQLISGLHLDADTDDSLFEDFLQTRITIAARRQDSAAILEACEQGLARWPDSTRLCELKAEQLAATDPIQSLELLKCVLISGAPSQQTAYQYLALAGGKSVAAAKRVIAASEVDRRQQLAELFVDVLNYNTSYLQWAAKTFPQSETLRWRLAAHYSLIGRSRRAVSLAKQLHAANPDSPEMTQLLGRCLAARSPKKALKYLQQACEHNRSADTLFELARCRQAIGDKAYAKQTYWELLRQNPSMAAVWTNLVLLGEPKHELWPYVDPMLRQGRGVHEEYFLVAVVKIARALREPVAREWLALAVARLGVLRSYRGFQDERMRLGRAVRDWLAARPQDRKTVSGRIPAGVLEQLFGPLLWPGRKWIPRG